MTWVQIPAGASFSPRSLAVFGHELTKGKPMIEGNHTEKAHRTRRGLAIFHPCEAIRLTRVDPPESCGWQNRGAITAEQSRSATHSTLDRPSGPSCTTERIHHRYPATADILVHYSVSTADRRYRKVVQRELRVTIRCPLEEY